MGFFFLHFFNLAWSRHKEYKNGFSVGTHLKAENCPKLINYIWICCSYAFMALVLQMCKFQEFWSLQIWVKKTQINKIYSYCRRKPKLKSNDSESEVISKYIWYYFLLIKNIWARFRKHVRTRILMPVSRC